MPNTNPSTPLLRHVVLWKFKKDATPEQIHSVEVAFAALPDQIANIASLEWGTNVSVENLAHGFTHCFLVTFKSEADRAAYLPHPAHKAFGELARPFTQEVLVIDYLV